MFYKSVVVECATSTEDLAKAIEKKAEEMLNKETDSPSEKENKTDTLP